MPFRLSFCVFLLAFSTGAVGDTVWLKNGDRLTGEIVLMDSTKLLLETPYAGSVPIDREMISTLQSDHELLVKWPGGNGEVSKTVAAGQPGRIVVSNGEKTTVELASVTRMLRPKPFLQDLEWTGDLEFDINYERAERDTDDFDLALNNQARHGPWRHNLQADYNRKFRDDVRIEQDWSAKYALDRFVTESRFWQTRYEYQRDWFENVRRRRSLGAGPGYQFWDNELGAFSLAWLLSYNQFSYAERSDKAFYALGMQWDYNRYLVGKTFELFSRGSVGKALSGVEGYSVDAEFGVRYRLTDWASLSMKVETDLVKDFSEDLDETDYSLGLGIGW
ncbi:DUF481 domain-containing protein [Alloalcanivorax xenomutans]|jgi:hypothetical protein|uniref:DUF481 domain-containing protein n=1 Tax=Alloalcanivorax xenomutans TaxID=1094342 RepID=UPI000E251EA0|nr:DUF481 domain-containing protein [Alloalcanivorax xenomutans]MCE7524374.1 DUF481 domain-containing protein [Alloalcanivorax xenomutans]